MTSEQWEKEFEELTSVDAEYKLKDKGVQELLKTFISSLLTRHEQELRERLAREVECMMVGSFINKDTEMGYQNALRSVIIRLRFPCRFLV